MSVHHAMCATLIKPRDPAYSYYSSSYTSFYGVLHSASIADCTLLDGWLLMLVGVLSGKPLRCRAESECSASRKKTCGPQAKNHRGLRATVFYGV
jgi:hypothetical protein